MDKEEIGLADSMFYSVRTLVPVYTFLFPSSRRFKRVFRAPLSPWQLTERTNYPGRKGVNYRAARACGATVGA